MSEKASRPRRRVTSAEAREELDALFEQETARLESRRRDLARIRELLSALGASDTVVPTGALEPLPAELAAGTVSQLLRESRGMMRNLVLILDEGPAFDDEAVRAAQERIRSGVQHRTLYPAYALDRPISLQWVRTWAAVGEVQRMVPTVETEFAVFGHDAVIALSRWGDLDSGYVISRDPLVVDLHIAYFEQVWSHSHPMSAAISDLKDDERLIELLGLGIKDESIARILGLGLRTVRRRIATLMAIHAVDTRFQLGVAIGSARAAAGQDPPHPR